MINLPFSADNGRFTFRTYWSDYRKTYAIVEVDNHQGTSKFLMDNLDEFLKYLGNGFSYRDVQIH